MTYRNTLKQRIRNKIRRYAESGQRRTAKQNMIEGTAANPRHRVSDREMLQSRPDRFQGGEQRETVHHAAVLNAEVCECAGNIAEMRVQKVIVNAAGEM